jgi:hypothetical protein
MAQHMKSLRIIGNCLLHFEKYFVLRNSKSELVIWLFSVSPEVVIIAYRIFFGKITMLMTLDTVSHKSFWRAYEQTHTQARVNKSCFRGTYIARKHVY